jgi:hypothetical protein
MIMSGKPKYTITKDYLVNQYVCKNRSTTNIAKELGCATNTVRFWLNKYSISLRGQGSHHVKNISGQVFGNWTVLNQVESDKKTKFSRWLCKCVCGKELIIHYGGLITNKRKMCHKCASFAKRSHEELTNTYWGSVLKSAKDRSLEISVSKDEAYSLFLKQNRICALTGLPISLPETTVARTACTASLDRIDSTQGYVINNIQWIHKDINRMKWKHSEDYFVYMCSLVVKHNTQNVSA